MKYYQITEIIHSVHHIHQGLNINVLGGCNRLIKVICLFSFQTRVSRRQFVLLLFFLIFYFFLSKRGPIVLLFKVLLYLVLYIEGNERCKVIQSQSKHYICFVFIKTRIFLQTFPINNIVYIIFWPWRPVNIL